MTFSRHCERSVALDLSGPITNESLRLAMAEQSLSTGQRTSLLFMEKLSDRAKNQNFCVKTTNFFDFSQIFTKKTIKYQN
ncbi:MAG: hypothetical protein ACWA6Y_08015 [Polaromonas sp.]